MTKLDPRWSFLTLPVLAALGCSDPVPLPNQGAVDLSIHTPTTHVDQKTCPVSGTTYDIGDALGATSKNGTPVTVISGSAGATVSCSVRGGSPFTFSGTIHGNNTSDGSPVDISLTGGTMKSDFTGTVDVSVYTMGLGNRMSSTTPCTVTAVNKQIKGGSMWAKVACAQIETPPSNLCGLDATIVFEDCDGS